MFLGTQNANNITSLYCKCVDTTQLCPLQLQPTTKGWKANMLVNFQASLHALCTFQHPRVYGMLGHREGPVTQPVWSPVTRCWPKPGSIYIWGLEAQFGLGDLCLHSQWAPHAAIIPPTSVALSTQRFPPVSIPPGRILTTLLDGRFSLPPLKC